MPSSGVYYGKKEQFDVISILDGKVVDIKEDTTLGNSITIEHDDNITTIYQSITDINVKVGDTVTQGTVIAKSSTSNIASDLNNHLYFEMNINGKTVNPEDYYEKAIDEL
jgi:stage II sporulation protein Q